MLFEYEIYADNDGLVNKIASGQVSMLLLELIGTGSYDETEY